MDFEDRNLIWLTFQRLFTPKLKPGEDWAKEGGLVWGGGRGGCCPSGLVSGNADHKGMITQGGTHARLPASGWWLW